VDGEADGRHLEREPTFRGGGERYDDVIHEEVDGHAVQNTRRNGVCYEEGQHAACPKVDGSGRKRDEKVTDETKQRRRESAVERPRPQQSTGDALQEANRPGSEETIGNERGGDVQ